MFFCGFALLLFPFIALAQIPTLPFLIMFADFLPPCNFFANILGFIPTEEVQLQIFKKFEDEKIDCKYTMVVGGFVLQLAASFAFLMVFHSAGDISVYKYAIIYIAVFPTMLINPLVQLCNNCIFAIGPKLIECSQRADVCGISCFSGPMGTVAEWLENSSNNLLSPLAKLTCHYEHEGCRVFQSFLT